jgi:arginine exporter protein ArgO
MHFRMHANRWLMPAILLFGFACIVVWAWLKFRKYRKAMDEPQANWDMLSGKSSRELDKDE